MRRELFQKKVLPQEKKFFCAKKKSTATLEEDNVCVCIKNDQHKNLQYTLSQTLHPAFPHQRQKVISFLLDGVDKGTCLYGFESMVKWLGKFRDLGESMFPVLKHVIAKMPGNHAYAGWLLKHGNISAEEMKNEFNVTLLLNCQTRDPRWTMLNSREMIHTIRDHCPPGVFEKQFVHYFGTFEYWKQTAWWSMHCLLKYHEYYFAECLLECGADVNALNTYGEPPLFFCKRLSWVIHISKRYQVDWNIYLNQYATSLIIRLLQKYVPGEDGVYQDEMDAWLCETVFSQVDWKKIFEQRIMSCLVRNGLVRSAQYALTQKWHDVSCTDVFSGLQTTDGIVAWIVTANDHQSMLAVIGPRIVEHAHSLDRTLQVFHKCLEQGIEDNSFQLVQWTLHHIVEQWGTLDAFLVNVYDTCFRIHHPTRHHHYFLFKCVVQGIGLYLIQPSILRMLAEHGLCMDLKMIGDLSAFFCFHDKNVHEQRLYENLQCLMNFGVDLRLRPKITPGYAGMVWYGSKDFHAPKQVYDRVFKLFQMCGFFFHSNCEWQVNSPIFGRCNFCVPVIAMFAQSAEMAEFFHDVVGYNVHEESLGGTFNWLVANLLLLCKLQQNYPVLPNPHPFGQSVFEAGKRIASKYKVRLPSNLRDDVMMRSLVDGFRTSNTVQEFHALKRPLPSIKFFHEFVDAFVPWFVLCNNM